jgi:hypothetical protein
VIRRHGIFPFGFVSCRRISVTQIVEYRVV